MMASPLYKNTCPVCSTCSNCLKAFTGNGLSGTRGARRPERVEHVGVPRKKQHVFREKPLLARVCGKWNAWNTRNTWKTAIPRR